MFFNKPKDELKQIMREKIRQSYNDPSVSPSVYQMNSTFNPNIANELQGMMREYAREFAKAYSYQAIDILIDHLYTNEDFEKDIGLK